MQEIKYSKRVVNYSKGLYLHIMELGQKIRIVRNIKGFSQEYMADKLGVSQNFIHKLEKPGSKINNEYLNKICIILDKSIQELSEMSEGNVFNKCANPMNSGTITINHEFPEELIQVLKKMMDKK